MDEISRAINRVIRHFQKGIASTVIGFAYAAIVQAFATTFLGPYAPPILVSAAMFIWGVLSDAQTLTDQDHWFVFGVIFISVFIDLVSLILGTLLLFIGLLLRRFLEDRGYYLPKISW